MANIARLTTLIALCCGATLALPKAELRAAAEPYSFDDIFNTTLRPRGFSPRWISGEEAFYYRKNGDLLKYNAESETEAVFLPSAVFNAVGSGTYFMSSDSTHVLFAYNTKALWRHSFGAKYKIWDIAANASIPFPHGGGPWDDEGELLDFAGWAPSSLALSFVYKNDLYYQADLSTAPRRLTTDGNATDIFNGVPDWMYEEDVISDRVSHYWSPDSKYIVFARIDVTDVPFQSWPVYGEKLDVYGKTREVRCPKAGDVRPGGVAGPISKAELFAIDVSDAAATRKPLEAPAEFALVDHYYLQVAWASDAEVYITWANRVQNHSISAFYDVTAVTPTPEIGLDYKVTGGWVEVPPPRPIFLDSRSYITIHPEWMNDVLGSWRHLGVYSHATKNVSFLPRGVGNGMEEIDGIYGYDSIGKYVYYSSTNGDPIERHINRIGLEGAAEPAATCLTCSQSAGCRYITSSFSSSMKHYMLGCRGPEIPTYTLRSIDSDTKSVVFENNADVKERLDEKDLPERLFLRLAINGENEVAEFFTPPGHVAGNTYPLLIYAYAGPGSQRVSNLYPIGGSTTNWLRHLSSVHKIAVASVDSRGASGYGDKYKFHMYRNLGTVEIQDQIEAARQLRLTTGRVDSEKARAIFGWSYGGFAAAHVIGDVSKEIMCGISVAPVTSNAFYNSAYTERYLALATPDDDELGYNRTDVMNKVENFRDKKFMIAHGMADDNVHYMHTTHLISALSAADIMFRQNAYIDQNHGIGDPYQSRHLYHSMTEFLLNDCWDSGEESKEPEPDPNGFDRAGSVSGSGLVVLALTTATLLSRLIARV